MKQRGFHRNKTSIAHFREVCLATSWRTVIECFCQSTSSHFKSWPSAYSPDQFTPPNAGEAASARKEVCSGSSSSAVSAIRSAALEAPPPN